MSRNNFTQFYDAQFWRYYYIEISRLNVTKTFYEMLYIRISLHAVLDLFRALSVQNLLSLHQRNCYSGNKTCRGEISVSEMVDISTMNGRNGWYFYHRARITQILRYTRFENKILTGDFAKQKKKKGQVINIHRQIQWKKLNWNERYFTLSPFFPFFFPLSLTSKNFNFFGH